MTLLMQPPITNRHKRRNVVHTIYNFTRDFMDYVNEFTSCSIFNTRIKIREQTYERLCMTPGLFHIVVVLRWIYYLF